MVWIGGFVEQGWEEADAVFSGLSGQWLAGDFGEGGHEVDLADEAVVDAVGGDVAGPAGDEGDAMAAFVGIGFVAAVDVIWLVAGVLKFLEASFGRAAVVGGEDQKCFLINIVCGQSFQKSADIGVELHDEVGICIQAATPLPGGGRNDRCMRGGQCHVGEKRLAAARLGGAVSHMRQEPVHDAALDVDGFE